MRELGLLVVCQIESIRVGTRCFWTCDRGFAYSALGRGHSYDFLDIFDLSPLW